MKDTITIVFAIIVTTLLVINNFAIADDTPKAQAFINRERIAHIVHGTYTTFSDGDYEVLYYITADGEGTWDGCISMIVMNLMTGEVPEGGRMLDINVEEYFDTDNPEDVAETIVNISEEEEIFNHVEILY